MTILTICLMIAVLILSFYLESRRELNMLRVTGYSVSSEKLPDWIRGKNIVFISDFHEAEDGALNDRILEEIKKASPELILVGGDMVNGNEAPGKTKPAADLIKELSKDYKVLYAYGNHERKMEEDKYGTKYLWEEMLGSFNENVHLLKNERYDISSEEGKGIISIYGLDIPLKYYGRVIFPKPDAGELSEMLGSPDKNNFNILLGHAPDFFKSYCEWGADMVFSGHFHGGMIRLPLLGGIISPRHRPFPKYDYGIYESGSTKMFVTNGLGQHSLSIRINNIPEIVVIKFR